MARQQQSALDSPLLTASQRIRLARAGKEYAEAKARAEKAYAKAVEPLKRRLDADVAEAERRYDSTVETLMHEIGAEIRRAK